MTYDVKPSGSSENDIFVIEDQDSPDQFLRRLAQASKRKRVDSPQSATGDPTFQDQGCITISKAKSILSSFTELAKLTEKLAQSIDRNTKKEITELSLKLTRKTAKLNNMDMWDWLEEIVDKSIESWNQPPAPTVDQSTQTEEHITAEDDQSYTQDLTAPGTTDELSAALEKNWPEACFKHTSLAIGNPLTYKDKPDIAMLLTDTEMPLDTGIYKIIGDHIPELRKVDIVDANPKCLKLSTRFQKDGEWTESHRNIYKMHINSCKPEDILTAMRILVDAAIGDERTALSIPVVTEVDPITIRKLAEIASNNKHLKIKIHGPRSIMDKVLTEPILTSEVQKTRLQSAKQDTVPLRTINAKATGAAKEKVGPRKQNSAILIRTQGKEYSQVLKVIKDTFTAQKDKPTVSGITETKKGDVLITTDNEINATFIQNTLAEKFASENVVLKTGKKRILHVKNIDAISSKTEVEQAIKLATTNIQGSIEITNVRPSFGNCQNATVRTNDKIAEWLLQNGYVVIGFTRDDVEHTITPQRTVMGQTAHACA